MAMSTISSSLTPGRALFHVNVPTHDQATVTVAQVRDALNSMYVSSQSLRARATSSDHVNNRAMVAYRLMTESPETQEVVAQVVSDPDVFAAIWGKLQSIPKVFEKIVEIATSCLLPRDGVDLTEEDEIISFADHKSRWVRMFQKVVNALKTMWNGLVDMFPSVIRRIQAAFAREGDAAGGSRALETALIITGLVVLVTVVIVVGTVLVL